jgi:hypothetical protein
VCKCQFEETGLYGRQEECARVGFRSLLVVGQEGEILGLVQKLKLPAVTGFSLISDM